MFKLSPTRYVLGALVVGAAALAVVVSRSPDDKPSPPAGAASPALSVTLVQPQRAEWPRTLSAYGNVAAWQEAVIGAEIGDYRLTEVRVDVGDTVKKGQLLASIASETIAAELAQAKATVAEAEAMLAAAKADAERARQVETSGAMTAQQIYQYLTAEQTALARVNAARARVEADELRLSKTRVVAPENGVISARAAAAGSLARPGQELFRLIIGNRLEWRAEVTAADLGRIKPGMAVRAAAADGAPIRGKVRMVAPTVDPQTRNAIVYVDLPVGCAARAGMFARGEFDLGRAAVLAVPQSAVLLRDGFAYVFSVGSPEGNVYRAAQTKVGVGRRVGDQIEIIDGLTAATLVVAGGAGFLADGDLVRVVADGPAAVHAGH